ncbi:MAG: glycerol-3-phosphate dehydrogenase subunit GlpB [Bacteroidales bacterium]|nr:glycerol-3-phosphate dehydrogenase subunit GlpB [Bacteroidales bacterium]
MKFDVVIIGGGLAGLTCGISLQRKGRRCAIVSAGQSALHFSSGYFDFLDRTPDGKAVENPLDAVYALPEGHPYRKIGVEDLERYMGEVKPLFAGCGIELKGDWSRNCYRITPVGGVCPSWLCLGEFTPFTTAQAEVGRNVMVVNIPGYMDFNARFVAAGLEKRGAACRIVDVTVDELSGLRANPSEMRSSNIARLMDSGHVAVRFAEAVRMKLSGEDAVVLPAFFGLKDSSVPQKVAEIIGVRTEYVATMTPSVPGIRTQMRLRAAFERLGGTYILGDTVMPSEIRDGRVVCLSTVNFGNEKLYADAFVLAAGSFFSNGLAASRECVTEPVFGLDVHAADDRSKWGDMDFFKRQEYIGFGVKSDADFHAVKDGVSVSNLYVAGSVAGGYNPIAEGSGAGTAIMSAMSVAEHIISKIG